MESLDILYEVNELGSGHAFRARVVAEELLKRGHTVTFFTSPLDNHIYGHLFKG